MSTNAAKNNRVAIFEERLNKLRGNMSQDEFAKKIGIARATVGFYENGERIPDASYLIKIAQACEVSTDWLLGLTDDKAGRNEVMDVEKRLGLTPATQHFLRINRNIIPNFHKIFNSLCTDELLKLINNIYRYQQIEEIIKIIKSKRRPKKITGYREMITANLQFVIQKITDDGLEKESLADSEHYSIPDDMIQALKIAKPEDMQELVVASIQKSCADLVNKVISKEDNDDGNKKK
jgi:transcriptional regulator with XRE-family HTH domain